MNAIRRIPRAWTFGAVSIRIAVSLVVLIALASALPGCATSNDPYSPLTEASRDTAEAQRLTQQAAKILDSHPDKAEKLLREALNKDLYHGPAHNNLGVLCLKQGQLYSAAAEFEWARKVMPGHPDPRVNLALTLERAGRINDALKAYAAALEVYPEYLAAVQGLARLQVRHDLRDERTTPYLRDIAFRGESAQWRDWAQQALLEKDRSADGRGAPR